MTALEKSIRDILMQYGFHRHCKCYREKCLVLPKEMIDLSVQTIARHVFQETHWKGYTREITEKGGEKE